MFYGWKLLATLCCIYFLTTGTVFYGFSVVLPAMITDMGWSRTEASLGFSLLFLIPGLSGPAIAWLIGRQGARKTIALGGVFVSTGVFSIYYMSSLTQFYLSIAGLVGIGVAMQTVIPGTQLLTIWFARRRALAFGIFLAMGGAGAFVAAPAFSYLLEATGEWRTAWLVMAGASLTGSVLSLLFVRNHPEEMNTIIDGGEIEDSLPTDNDETEDTSKTTSHFPIYQTTVSWELKDAVGTAAFWIIIAAASFAIVGQTIVSSQGMIHMIDLSIPTVTAGTVLGTVGMLSASGRIVSGILGDRYDPRYMLAGGLVLELLALLIFNHADSVPVAYLFAILFGAGNGLALVASPALVANYFGAKNYAGLIGLRGLVITPVAASGPLIAAGTFEALGSYTPVFYGFAVLAILPVIAVMLMHPPLLKTTT